MQDGSSSVAVETAGEDDAAVGRSSSAPRPYQFLRGRRPIQLPASAKLFPGCEWDVRVVNVSVGGVACECDSDARVGSQIILHIEGLGQIPALVRWSSGSRFGARFNGRIDVPEKELIAKLLGMSRTGSAPELPSVAKSVKPPCAEAPANADRDSGWEFEIEQIQAYQLALLDRLEGMTAAAAPDQAALADLRLKLVRATRERRDLLQSRVFPDIEKRSPRSVSMIARLRAKDEELRRASAEHVGRWSIDAIMANWRGYCAASNKLRPLIRAQIAAEQEVIFLARRMGSP